MGKVISIRLSDEHYEYIKSNIPNFSEWVRQKLDEEIMQAENGASFMKRLLTFLRGHIVIERIGNDLYLSYEPYRNGKRHIICKVEEVDD